MRDSFMTRFLAAAFLFFPLILPMSHAQLLDIQAMWNFRDPQASEARFRDALKTANANDAFVLNTQIARTFGLRRDFTQARAHLASLTSSLEKVGAEAQTRYWLELGRTYASATHQPGESDDAKAREAYANAMRIARANQLDGLFVDVIHMMAFVDRTPADQLRWGNEALAVVLASKQPQARAWEASIRNNIGIAHRDMGELTRALAEFQQAATLREALGDPHRLHVARWMIANTLRIMKRTDDALALQLTLRDERARAGEPDAYVFDELALLYAEKGDADNAQKSRDAASALRKR
jgi:tetratricopeptide (TPR) repeat protein